MMNTSTTSAKPYKSLLIEVRPRLQSVNVFVNLSCTYKEVNIILFNDYFEIYIDGEKYKIDCPNFSIITNSLTNLQKQTEYLYFRFSTNSLNNLGGFKSELLQLNRHQDSSLYQNNFLKLNIEYEINCSNCLQALCRNITFDRVLPLPSDASNQNDWFCHAHGDTEFKNLDPKLEDIFYSHSYFHVHPDLLSGVRSSSTNIHCRRCLYWLGIKNNSRSFRIWFNTVNFKVGEKVFKSDPLEDVLATIENNLQDNLMASSKIILYCQVSEREINYLLLWIMEKKLSILMENENGSCNYSMAKVLFKFQGSEDEEVKTWKQNFSVPTIPVSKIMMTNLVKHLYDMNSYIPKIFSISNNFYISYLTMDGIKN